MIIENMLACPLCSEEMCYILYHAPCENCKHDIVCKVWREVIDKKDVPIVTNKP